MQIFKNEDIPTRTSVDITIDEVIKKYSRSESEEKNMETVEAVIPSNSIPVDGQSSKGGSDISIKPFRINLENVFFNKDLVQKYNLLKNQKNLKESRERKSKKRKIMLSADHHAEPINSPTLSDFSLVSVPGKIHLDKVAESQNGSEFSTFPVPEVFRNVPANLQESQNEVFDRSTLCSPYSDNSNFSTNLSAPAVASTSTGNNFSSVINIRITRNVGASKAQITCVPLPAATNLNYDTQYMDDLNQSEADVSHGFVPYDEEEDFGSCSDEEDYYGPKIDHCWNTSVFSLENVIKLLSDDEMFESATLENFTEIPSSLEETKQKGPQIKFTFINDLVQKNTEYNQSMSTDVNSDGYQSSISSKNSSLAFRKPIRPAKTPNRDSKASTRKSTNVTTSKWDEKEDVLSLNDSSISWLENLENDSSVRSTANLETTYENYSNQSSSASSCFEKHNPERRNCVIQKNSTDGERSLTNRKSVDRIAETEETNSLTRRNYTERIPQPNSDVRKPLYRHIPSMFKGLCFLYFTFEGCHREKCNYQHYIPSEIIFNISNLDENDLLVAYDYCKVRYKLFMATFFAFAEKFAKSHCSQELLAAVNIVMKLGLTDKTPYIKKILSCLCDIGIPLIDAVEEIYQCGDSQLNITLADILLDIICISGNNESLLTNWCIVQSLIKDRKEPLDNELVKEVMQVCCKSKNVELAELVINDIVAVSLVNLDAFKRDTLMAFLDLVKGSPGESILQEKIKNIKHPLLPTPLLPTCNENGQLSSPSENPVSGRNDLALNDCEWPKVTKSCFSDQSSSTKSISTKSTASRRSNSVNKPIFNNLNNNFSNNSPIYANDDRSVTNSTDIPTCDEQLPEDDLMNLKKIIDYKNVLEFFIMFTKYRASSLNHTFLLNTLAYLKTKKPEDIHIMICELFDGIENVYPDDVLDSLSLLVANVLGILEAYGSYKMAAQILLKYEGKFKDLVDLTWYSGPHRNIYTEMGKYIYFCKILVKGDYLKEAWSFLTSSELKLLQPMELCQFSYNRSFDSKFRDHVVEDLLQRALTFDILFAKDVILHLINYFVHTEFVNIWNHFNTLILNMIENTEFKHELRKLLKQINNLWYKNVNPAVLRKLLMSMINECKETVPDYDILTLYQKCCIRHCYEYIRGDEEKLFVKSDITDAELYAALCFYLYRKIKNNYPTTNLEIAIQFSSKPMQHPLGLTANIPGIKQRILRILSSSFPFSIIGYNHSHKNSVGVYKKHLEPNIHFYKKVIVNRE